MRLTKQTSYALRILIHCAVSGDEATCKRRGHRAPSTASRSSTWRRSCRSWCAEASSPRAAAGTGGLKLARAPEEIGIGDVIRVTEATHVEAECVGGTTLPCGIKRAAPINRMLGEALEAFIDVLDKHTLADLIGVEATRCDTARRRVHTARARRERREPLEAATGSPGTASSSSTNRPEELGFSVRAINVGEASATRENCMRLREIGLWFKGREWFQEQALLYSTGRCPDRRANVSHLYLHIDGEDGCTKQRLT